MGTSSQRDPVHGRAVCVAAVSPEVVDAGAEVTLKATVTCAPACDLRGHIVLVKDQAGAVVGHIELTEFDGEASHTRDLVVKAPVEAEDFTWWVVCPAVVREGVSYAEASVQVAFTVRPHAMSVLAWDIPSTIVAGERFRMKVGLKCSNECDLTNTGVGIYDDEGNQLAALSLGGDCWPGTTALHVAEVELDAPTREGLYTWSVRSAKSDVGIPHAEGSVSFGVRVVSPPDCVVTIEAVDRNTQIPLEGAHVTMHPYKAITDEHGVATVRVAKGTYKLFVSQSRFLTLSLPLEVTSDMTARAELEVEPVPERY